MRFLGFVGGRNKAVLEASKEDFKDRILPMFSNLENDGEGLSL